MLISIKSVINFFKDFLQVVPAGAGSGSAAL